MSDYDVLREMLERSPIPGKQSTGSGRMVDGNWVDDHTVDFDYVTRYPPKEGRQITIWRGYAYFYTVISFDEEGRLTDIEAYE